MITLTQLVFVFFVEILVGNDSHNPKNQKFLWANSSKVIFSSFFASALYSRPEGMAAQSRAEAEFPEFPQYSVNFFQSEFCELGGVRRRKMTASMRTVRFRIVFLCESVVSHSQVYPKSCILGVFSSGRSEPR